MKAVDSLLRRAARIAKRRGLALQFTPRDLGDLFHVYGKRATASQFVAMLSRRQKQS